MVWLLNILYKGPKTKPAAYSTSKKETASVEENQVKCALIGDTGIFLYLSLFFACFLATMWLSSCSLSHNPSNDTLACHRTTNNTANKSWIYPSISMTLNKIFPFYLWYFVLAMKSWLCQLHFLIAKAEYLIEKKKKKTMKGMISFQLMVQETGHHGRMAQFRVGAQSSLLLFSAAPEAESQGQEQNWDITQRPSSSELQVLLQVL